MDKPEYKNIVSEIGELISLLRAKKLKFTTYQAEFDTGWGEADIWFKRKLWEICTVITVTCPKPGIHRILDCGGASSIFSFYLAWKGCQVDTVDLDWRAQGIVENANFVAREMGLKNMNNITANMIKLPYPDETFDRIYSICVLEHLAKEDQVVAIKEMARALKQEGIIGLTFDYGPRAAETKYLNVEEINKRIVLPSGLEIYGNTDYNENGWFEERRGKTWGSLFMKKSNQKAFAKENKLVLSCSAPAENRTLLTILSLLEELKIKTHRTAVALVPRIIKDNLKYLYKKLLK